MSTNNYKSKTEKDLEIAIKKGKLEVAISREEIELLHSIPKEIEPVVIQVCLKHGFPLRDFVAVGSSQRKTFLPGSRDIDIFVRFDTNERFFLEDFADKVIPKIAKELKSTYTIKYAENPFGVIHYRINKQDIINIDLVATIWFDNKDKLPEVLKISGMARTPFHAFYLNNKIKGLEEEVRLFKYWAKKKKLYRQNGFTGFIVELLTLIYGSFVTILQNAKTISELTYDFNNRNKIEIREIFKDFPIVIIDPVDKNRNAAAGIHGILGKFHLSRFVKLAQESIKNPKTLWDPYTLTGNVFNVKIEFEKELIIKNEEEHYSRLGKILGNIFRALRENSIEIIDALLEVPESSIKISTNTKGGKKMVKKGPPITLKESSKKFKVNNDTTWIKNGFHWTEIKQKTVFQVVDTVLKKITIIESFHCLDIK